MKCPKCGYIGFEHTERCRNCGYDFVLADGAPGEPDLPLRKEQMGPLGDFDLGEAGRSTAGEPPRGSRRRYDPDFDPRITPPALGRPAAADLPLFGDAADDLPIVPASAAEPPLAVRRSTPLAAKARPRPTPRVIESTLAGATLPLMPPARPPEAGEAVAAIGAGDRDTARSALGVRVLAAILDALLLLFTDAVVIYFTLKICRLDPADIVVLPLVPLLAFLVLLNGGYLVLLTAAGGQTLGKMAFGLKVVATDEGRISASRSLVRAAALLVSALPAGLGLLPALFTAGHRGLHDLLAGTRVVRTDGT